jgi:hypothetical protein
MPGTAGTSDLFSRRVGSFVSSLSVRRPTPGGDASGEPREAVEGVADDHLPLRVADDETAV